MAGDFDLNLSQLRLAKASVDSASTILDDPTDVAEMAKGYKGDDFGILSLAQEWKLPKGVRTNPPQTDQPDFITWSLEHDAFPNGHGPGGVKAGLKIRVFADGRMQSEGCMVVRSRTSHSYWSITSSLSFKFSTTNHPVTRFGRATVCSGHSLRHGTGYREYPFVHPNRYPDAAAHFDELLRSDIDAWLYVWCDRDS